jgi:hypothetical protein
MIRQTSATLILAVLAAACGPDAQIEQSPDATVPGAEVPTTRDDVPANDPDTQRVPPR